jgi:uncharacterized protein YacL
MAEQKSSSIDEILNEARRALDFQFDVQDGLDTKSGILIGIAGVVITLMVTSLIGTPSLLTRIIAVIIVLVFFVSLILSYRNIRIRDWQKPPDIDALIKEYEHEDAHTTKCKLTGTIQLAIKKNQTIHEKRIQLYKWSYKILFFGLVLLAIAVIILAFT